MFNCQDARMACYIVFQSALKQLFARIFYTNIYAKLSSCAKLVYSSQQNQLGSSEMLTINLHGIGRHTRRLGPGISIYSKSVGCSISLLDHTEVQSTQYQYQISYAVVLIDGVCDPFIIVLEGYGLFFTGDGNIVCNTVNSVRRSWRNIPRNP